MKRTGQVMLQHECQKHLLQTISRPPNWKPMFLIEVWSSNYLHSQGECQAPAYLQHCLKTSNSSFKLAQTPNGKNTRHLIRVFILALRAHVWLTDGFCPLSVMQSSCTTAISHLVLRSNWKAHGDDHVFFQVSSI